MLLQRIVAFILVAVSRGLAVNAAKAKAWAKYYADPEQFYGDASHTLQVMDQLHDDGISQQPAKGHQVSFLGTSSQSESSAEMNQIAQAVQEQDKALIVIAAEQEQIENLQKQYAEDRFADNAKRIENENLPKDYSLPLASCKLFIRGPVTDDVTCGKACASSPTAYAKGGIYQENKQKGYFSETTYRCLCTDEAGAQTTICTDGAKMTSSLVVTIGMVILSLHM